MDRISRAELIEELLAMYQGHGCCGDPDIEELIRAERDGRRSAPRPAQPPLAEMNEAIVALALEVPGHVWDDLFSRWFALRMHVERLEANIEAYVQAQPIPAQEMIRESLTKGWPE